MDIETKYELSKLRLAVVESRLDMLQLFFMGLSLVSENQYISFGAVALLLILTLARLVMDKQINSIDE